MYCSALPVTVTERFAWIMTALLNAVGVHARYGVLAPIGGPICRRIVRVRNRILALIARIEAGTLRQFPRKGPGAARRTMDEATRRRLAEQATIWGRMPRQPGWLLPLVPCDAANLASQLSHLLRDEEMQRHLAATPRMWQTLRPMCRMLGIDAALLGAPVRARSERRRPRQAAPAPSDDRPESGADEAADKAGGEPASAPVTPDGRDRQQPRWLSLEKMPGRGIGYTSARTKEAGRRRAGEESG